MDTDCPDPDRPQCAHCDEPILPGDDMTTTNDGDLLFHRECLLRGVIGSVAHQRRECSCYGGTGEDDPNLTRREAARAAFRYWVEFGAVESEQA